jgi:alpha-tubulin suppressor-like RCC1 family protein
MTDRCEGFLRYSPRFGGIVERSTSRCALIPVPVESSIRFASIHAGGSVLQSTICGLDAGGAAYCWGDNSWGKAGVVSYDLHIPRPQPVVGPKFRSLSVGGQLTCGTSFDDVGYCWGNGRDGALGTNGGDSIPLRIAGGLKWRTVTAGFEKACGVTIDAVAYCWGSNSDGELGAGSITTVCSNGVPCATTPVRVQLNERVAEIAVGASSACALTEVGKVWCWGHGLMLGKPMNGAFAPPSSDVPVEVAVPATMTAIRINYHHACALATSGDVYCWGVDAPRLEQAGAVPTRVSVPPMSRLALGEYTACGLGRDGIAYCWGSDLSFGDDRGQRTDVFPPVRVAGQP